MRASPVSRAGVLAGVPAAIVLLIAVAGPAVGAASAATPTPASVLKAAKGAIAKQSSVHLSVASKSGSTAAQETIKADLGKTRGAETISEGTEGVMIRLTPTYAYLSGNSSGLTHIFGMTAAQAKKVGSRWVSIKAGTRQYKGLEPAMTVSSVATILPLAKSTTLSAPGPSAKNLYTLKWDTAATSSVPALATTLTISAVGPALPVKETTMASGGGRETVELSNWGEPVAVSAPRASTTIPYSKVSS